MGTFEQIDIYLILVQCDTNRFPFMMPRKEDTSLIRYLLLKLAIERFVDKKI